MNRKLAAALAGAALAGAAVVGGVTQLAGCSAIREDVNCDGRVNVIDMHRVALKFGYVIPTTEVPSSTATSTSIPSSASSTPSNTPTGTATSPAINTPFASATATKSATLTPVPIAPATSTRIPTASSTVFPPLTPVPTSVFPTRTPSAGNTIEQVIADLTLPHEGTICGTAGYDWEKHAANQGGVPGSGFTRGTGWGVANWNCGIGHNAGVVFETRNIWGGVWNGATWTRTTDHIGWCETMNPQTNVFDGPGCGGLGSAFNMPDQSVSLHWASDHNPLPSGVVCAFTTYQARVSGPGAAISSLMAGSGYDYWTGANNAIDPSFVGRYKHLTTQWIWINGSSCSAATLTAHPPPLQ